MSIWDLTHTPEGWRDTQICQTCEDCMDRILGDEE